MHDALPTVLYKTPCVDCAELSPVVYRVQRGGTYYDDPARITTIYRSYDYPTTRKPIRVSLRPLDQAVIGCRDA